MSFVFNPFTGNLDDTGAGGGGGGTPALPFNAVQFNNAGAFGGSANLIWDGFALNVTTETTATAFPGDRGIQNILAESFHLNNLTRQLQAIEAVVVAADVDNAIDYVIGQEIRVTVSAAMDRATSTGAKLYGTRMAAWSDSTHAFGQLYGGDYQAFTDTSDVDQMYGVNAQVANYSATGNVRLQAAVSAAVENNEGGNVTDSYGFYFQAFNDGGGGTVSNMYGAWIQGLGGLATNPYSFWSDEQGVFRIRSDNHFDSVYQAIPALYNPLFTKYTAGATNFERIVLQWETNVATLTTEAGGTGTLRALRLGDASVSLAFGGYTTNGVVTTTGGNGTIAVDGTYISSASSFVPSLMLMGG